MKTFLGTRGIEVTSTAGYDSNANGRAERAVQYFLDKSRTLLSTRIRSEVFQKQLKPLWTFAVQHVGELHRREVLGLEKCKYEFGQRILSKIKEPKTKLEPRMQPVVFLGYAPGVTEGYFVMKDDGTIELTSNITEDTVLDEPQPVLADDVLPRQESKEKNIPQEKKTPEELMLEAILGVEGGVGWQDENSPGQASKAKLQEDPFSDNFIKAAAKKIKAKVDDRLWEQEDLKPEEIPEQLKEVGAILVAMKDIKNSIGKQRERWRIAMLNELQSLYDKDAVQPVVHLPKGATVLPMKIVATLKNILNSVLRTEKIRGCVCGNFQKEDPLMLIYTANVDITSIRLVLSEVSQNETWGISTLDVKTAFLNADMPTKPAEQVYVAPPAIFVQFGLVKPGTIWRLKKAVYGLRQSPRLWGQERDKRLRELRIKRKKQVLKLVQSSIDVALWTLTKDDDELWDHNRDNLGYLLTYVDDFLIAGTRAIRNALEEEISRIWDIKSTGNLDQKTNEQTLGKSIVYLSTTIRLHPSLSGFTLSQESFIRDLLDTWQMAQSRPVVTPGEVTPSPELPSEGDPEDLDPEDIRIAQKLGGSLIWLSTRTRPDIAYAQSRISSMATKAPKRAIMEGYRVLRYLKGTINFRMIYRPCIKYGPNVIAYTDANHGIKRSQTGSVIKMGNNVITWKSAKQATISGSSAESEVQALALTETVADFVKTLRESMFIPTPMVTIRCDNNAAKVLATGEGSWKTKSTANKVARVKSNF